MLTLNFGYLIISCLYTYSSWIYTGTPLIQLSLQSILKIFIVSFICKYKTGKVPKIILYDKFLILASLLYSSSSLCTFHLWKYNTTNPFSYSMGTKPTLFLTNILQNGKDVDLISFLSIFGLCHIHRDTLPLFMLKCVCSALGSYLSSLGLDFGKESSFEHRCSKIVSFSFISALMPLYWSTSNGLPTKDFFEYAHAVLGALNGLAVAFVLSYNGAFVKVGLSSIKDMFFLLFTKKILPLNVISALFQGVVSAWVSFKTRKWTHQEPQKNPNSDTPVV